MKARGTAMWACVHTPNTTYEAEYSIKLIVNPETDKALKGLGLKGKREDEGIVYKFYRKQFRKDGTENKKPVVVSRDNTPFSDLVGNGSEVIVQFSTYEWSNSFGSGINADLQGVQVIDLVSYRPGDGEEFEVIEDDNSEPAKPGVESFDDDLPDVL